MTAGASPAGRVPEIDLLKAAGIVTIVLIHALRPPWDPNLSPLEAWLGHVTRFGVPAFLFASGFLHARTTPITGSDVRARLLRILVPYLAVSLLAHASGFDEAEASDLRNVALDVVLGRAFGPFYYVFVIVGLVCVSPWLVGLSARTFAIGLAVFVALQWFADAALGFGLELHWHLRNPAVWWAYYLAGWGLRLHGGALRQRVAVRRALFVGVSLSATAVCVAIAALDDTAPAVVVRSAAWLGVWSTLGALWGLAASLESSPAPLRILSDATYTVFLYHLFFVRPLRDALPLPAQSVDAASLLLPWIAGLAGPLLLLLAARALLGQRSRTLLGA